MSDYVVRTVPAVRLVAVTAVLDAETVGERVGPMFRTVEDALGLAPGAPVTPVATYSLEPRGMDVVVGYETDEAAPDGLEVVELPEAESVCGVHLGSMAGIQGSWQALHRWSVENGYSFTGPCREVYVRSATPDQADWITELQQPVAR